MGKGLIIAIVVVVILAAAAYMYLYGVPSEISIPASVTETATGAAESIVADTGEETAATAAETAATETADEIAAADNLEVPDVQ